MSKKKEIDLSGFYEELENAQKTPQAAPKKDIDLSGFYEELEPEPVNLEDVDLTAEPQPEAPKKSMPLDSYRNMLSGLAQLAKDAGKGLAVRGKAFISGAAEGATLGFRDELLARYDLLKGSQEDYKTALRRHEAEAKETREKYPISSIAGEIAGGAALPMFAVARTAKLAKGAPLAARFINLLKQGAVLAPAGAVMGATQELGSSEKTLDEMSNREIVEGLAAGAIRGGAVATAAPVILAAGSAGLKGAKKVADVLGSKIYLDEALDAAKLAYKKGIDLNEFDARRALSQEAVDLIKTPAEIAEAQIKSQKIAPLEFDISQQVKAMQEASEQAIAKQSRQIEEEALAKASSFLDELKDISKEAGGKIEKIKIDLLKKHPDKQLEALPRTIAKVERIIKKTPNLKSDPDALRILGDFKAELVNVVRPAVTKTETLSMKPTQGRATVKSSFKAKGSDLSPEELAKLYNEAPEALQKQVELAYQGPSAPFATEKLPSTNLVPDDMPAGSTFTRKVVSESVPETVQKEKIGLEQTFKLLRDIQEQGSALRRNDKLKQLGGLFTKAGGEAKSLLYSELEKFAEPKTVKDLIEANRTYSKFLNFSAKYNIDLTDPDAAVTELVKYAEKIPIDAKANLSANAQVREFLSDLRKISPKLAETFKSSFEQVKAQIAKQPTPLTEAQILKAAQEAVELGSDVPLKTLKNAGADFSSEDLTKLVNRVKELREAEELAKAVDYKRLLSTSKGALDTSNLRSFKMFDEFKQALNKTLSPEDMQTYGSRLDEALKNLRTARAFDDDINVGSYRRSVISTGANLGTFARDVIDTTKAGKELASPVTKVVSATSKGIGKGVSKGLDAIQNYSPRFLSKLVEVSRRSGKGALSSALTNMQSKDNIARGAALFLLRQDPKLKKDLEEVLSEAELEGALYEE